VAAGLMGLLLAFRLGSPSAAPVNAGDAPDGLKLVPPNAVAFVTVDLAALWAKAKDKPPAIPELEKGMGLTPGDFNRVTFVTVGSSPGEGGVGMVVTTTKAFDPTRLMKFLVPRGKEMKHKDKVYLATGGDHGDAAYALGDRAFFFGEPICVRALIDHSLAKTAEGSLTPDLRLAEKRLLVAALDGPSFLKALVPPMILDNLPEEAAPFKPLLKMQHATLTGDLDKDASLDARLVFPNEANAKEASKALQAVLDQQLRPAYGQLQKAAAKNLKDAPRLLALVEEGGTALRDLKPVQKDSAVEMTARVKVDPAVLGETLAQMAERVREASARIQGANQLKQIGLAMHNYHDVFAAFPASAIYDKAGRPLLSWRVQLLPYLDEEKLYKEFHLDEPWDSEHNKKLLEKIPEVFAPQKGQTSEKYTTFYQGFVGPDAFFEGKRGIRIASITDGTSNTLMIVEAANAVPWTKPDDLPYNPKKPLPKLGGHFKGGFNALFCDGSVHFIKDSIAKETLHLLIQRSDGQVIPNDF
jgi:prepilin-type processing-associated H-X9-DG protein